MSDPGTATEEGFSADLAVAVEPVRLLGVQLTALAFVDGPEHQRHSAFGLAQVTDPALLDRLLRLPARRSACDPVLGPKLGFCPLASWTAVTRRAS